MSLLSVSLVAITLLSRTSLAQGADFSVPSRYTLWDNDNWVLTTNSLIQGQYQSRAPLANGYIGCGIAAAGPFFEADVNLTDPNGGALPVNGWPLFNPRQTFCTVSGFFNLQANTTETNFPENLKRGAESVIAGIPNWPNLVLQVGDATLDATVDNTTISNFTSSRSLKNGMLSWTYQWTPSPSVSLNIEYQMFAHRDDPNVAAIKLVVSSASDVNATIVDLLDGRGSVRSTPKETGIVNGSNTIFSSVTPHWLPDIFAYIYSTVESTAIANGTGQNASDYFYRYDNASTIARAYPISIMANMSMVVTKYVGIASSDGFDDPKQTAMNASMSAASSGFMNLFNESAAAWAELMHEDYVDDYSNPDGSPPSDQNVLDMQIITKANTHYLLQSLLPSDDTRLARWSISVGGLTSDSYAGLIFWDADTFMSPGVTVAHPDYAHQIADYRVQLTPQAMRNAVNYSYSEGSVLFPWTSGRFGNCTGTGPCIDYEYHINNDIFLNNMLYWRVNAADEWFESDALPINQGVLQFYSQLMQYNDTVHGYSINNLTDPDEYANQVPDGAFTLASVAKDIEFAQGYAAQFNLTLPANYSAIAANPALPFAKSGILAEYLGANNTAVIKQDDVDLINYPLDYSSDNYTEADKLTSLEYYSNLQSPDGPAMTYSLYSISANSLYPSGCSAHTYALNGFLPYTRAPWYQFSEQQVDDPFTNGGTHPAFPFMTGAGGWHQVGPMGWLGMRAVEDQLVIQPALPPQIPYVSLRTIIYAGTGLKATINYTTTTLTRVDVSDRLPVNATDKYANQPLPFTVGFDLETGVNMTISMNQTLYIPNREYFSNITTAGDILQCLPAASTSAVQPGQFPLAAVDGSASTRWQPATLNATSMTVNTSSVAYKPLIGAAFNWGSRPPVSARITISNTSSATSTTVLLNSIGISQPYNADTVAIIKPYVGNASYFAFSQPVWSGDVVSLAIAGCQMADGEAATVGEFSLLDQDGESVLQGQNPTTVTPSAASGTAVATQGLGTSAPMYTGAASRSGAGWGVALGAVVAVGMM